jgi:hypothetical protein
MAGLLRSTICFGVSRARGGLTVLPQAHTANNAAATQDERIT